jgi:hypothetical protein
MKIKLDKIRKHYGGTQELDPKTYVKFDTEQEWVVTEDIVIDTDNPEESRKAVLEAKKADLFVAELVKKVTLRDLKLELERIKQERATGAK